MNRVRIHRTALAVAFLAAGLALTCIGTCALVVGEIDPSSIVGT